MRGYYPYAGVPGHEFVGTVEAASGAPEWVGRRVAGEINAACGECATCRAGRRTHCEKRTVLGIVARDGAFATHLSLPIANLHAVPDARARRRGRLHRAHGRGARAAAAGAVSPAATASS